jgi:hypothetical protein
MIEDEILMAYVDGELDAAARAEVEAQIARDPAAARRLWRHRDLRTNLSQAFSDVLAEPPPVRLIAAAMGAAAPEVAAASAAPVVDLAAVRGVRRQGRRRVWPVAGLMAACLAAGLALGVGFRPRESVPTVTVRDGALVAQGPLADALEYHLASNQARDAPIRIGISFPSRSREYCRTFVINRGQTTAGLACRGPAAWSVRVAVPAPLLPGAGEYRTAGSDTPPEILRMVDDLSAGPPLDIAGESIVRMRQWQF